MRISRAALSLSAVLLLTSRANAQTVVYDHGGVLESSPPGTSISFLTVAVTFTLAMPTAFDGIRFWDAEGYSCNRFYSGNGFNWAIYTNNAGLPGSTLVDGTTTPVRQALGPLPGFDGDYFQNDLSIGSITLTAGTYWLALRDNWPVDDLYDPQTGCPGNIEWDAVQVRQGLVYQPGAAQKVGTSTWGREFFDHAYQLTQSLTVTPEPAPVVLFATGLVCVFGFTRRRAKRIN